MAAILDEDLEDLIADHGMTAQLQVKSRTETDSGYAETWSVVAVGGHGSAVNADVWIEDIRGAVDPNLHARLDERVTHIVHAPVIENYDVTPGDYRWIGQAPSHVAGIVFNIIGTAGEVFRGLADEGYAGTQCEYHCSVEPGEVAS
jgi:hypothetical protein